MRSIFKSFFTLALVLTFASTVFCDPADSTSLLTPALDQDRIEGFNNLYNMNYPRAKEYFVAMTKIAPEHPAGYIYLAATIWLEHLAALRRLQTGLYNRNDAFFTGNAEVFDPSVDK